MRIPFVSIIAFVSAIGTAQHVYAQTNAKWRPSETERKAVVQQTYTYFALKDRGDYKQAYNLLSETLRGYLPFDKWHASSQNFNAKAGSVKKRKIVKVTWYRNPRFAPKPGTYAAVDFISKFQNVDIHCGYLVWYQQPDRSFLLLREEQNYMSREMQNRLEPKKLASLKAKLGCGPR